jgi:predicted N-acetyltransferase YhbS
MLGRAMPITLEHLGDDRLADLLATIVTSMGGAGHPSAIDRWKQMSELELRLGAVDDREGGAVVGTLGGYSFELSLPRGGSVPTQGLTLVGVRPTHRRRGILRQMIELAFEHARLGARPVGALFASEASIYGRFGYGNAAPSARVHVDKHRFAPARAAPA